MCAGFVHICSPISSGRATGSLNDGLNLTMGKEHDHFAFVVADGGVLNPVPIAPALYLFCSDLIGLVGIARRKTV